MRLIDADAYAAEMRKKQDNCRAWKDSLDNASETYARAEQSFVTFIEAALTLKSQPTIDAIPVDWLVQMRDLRRAAVAAHPDISEGSMAVLRGINMVLELWEDEKEAR